MGKRLLLSLIVAGAVGYAPAAADSFKNWDNYCGSIGGFGVCASVRIQVTDAGLLTMQVWNMEGVFGDPHTITAVGLYHVGGWMGAGTFGSASYVNGGSTDISSYWTADGNEIKTLGGVDATVIQGTSGNAGVNGMTLLPGGQKWQTYGSFPGTPYVELTFNLSDWTGYSAEDFELRWHSKQIGPDGEWSYKCDTGGYGDYGPCTSVPEPFTIALLGSGLASMGGFGFLRRRKKGLDV